MRLLLKFEGKLYNAYWIKRHNGGVVGWFGGRGVLSAMFGPDAPTDAHFYYPKDGNLHFSFKFHDVNHQLSRVENVYFDHVKVKDLSCQPVPHALTRVRSDESPHEVLVPVYHPRPISGYSSPHLFQFPLSAIPTSSAASWGRMFSTVATCRSDDLVVNVSDHPPGVLNISGLLSSQAQSREVTNHEFLYSSTNSSSYPVITLQALFVPTK